MKFLIATLLIAFAILTAGCERYIEVYSVRFLSKTGETLGTGTIGLKSPLPAAGKIRAKYQLQLAPVPRTEKAVDWFYLLFEGKERGEMEWEVRPDSPDQSPLVLEFMPGLSDANIVGIASKLQDGKSSGEWWYSVMAGGDTGGILEIERK